MKRTLSFYALFFMICLALEKTSGILSKIVLARYITPYEYGIITLVVISLPGMFQVLTNFCFHPVLSHAKEGRKSFGFSIVYSVVTSLIVGMILLFFHEPFFDFLNLPLESWHILFLAFFIFLLSVSILGDILGLLRGLKKYRLNNVLSTLPAILKLLFILVAVYFLHITEFTILLLIFAIPTSIVLFLALIKERKLIFSSLRPALLPSKNMFLFGFSIFSIGAFRLLTEPINRIIISHELGILWQGYYDVSFTLAAILFFSFGAMQFISVPEATGAKNKENILLKSGELGDVTRGLFAFLTLGVILLYFYAGSFVDLLFSHEYAIAGDYVFILAIGYIFLFIQQFLAHLNISFSHDVRDYKPFIIITLICLVISPFITLFLIRLFGFLGAYLSSTLSLFIYTVATIIYSKDRSPLFTLLHKVDRLIIVSLITFFLLYFLKLSLLYGLLASTCIYVLLIFSFGYVSKELVLGLFR